VTDVLPDRIRLLDDAPARGDGRYVLYWMIASRRLSWNHALDRAVEHARALSRPLLVFEPLRAGYEHACDRFHAFVMDGMRDHAREADAAGVRYVSYVEPEVDSGKGLLKALAAHACVVVTDDHPAFHYPALLEAAARQVDVRLEAVDGNGLLPMRAAPKAFPTAYAFRRHLQKTLPVHLEALPSPNPLRRLAGRPKAVVPREVLDRWPPGLPGLAALPIDHAVRRTDLEGGAVAGRRALRRFVKDRLADYAEARNDPAVEATSGLSPFLHFGHVGAAQVFAAVARREGWDPSRLGAKADGRRAGWWGMSASAEAFLDQLVTWRELGFNMAHHRPDAYMDFDSLPEWARRTLGEHERDERPHLYTPEALEAARTHDEIWNAAQRQLVSEGRIHNYLRMLWGKKFLEWSPTPRQALEVMIRLNDRYALDGRDPNSYSGIFWVLGRYDRPWGPEREIFGTVRYMSSENTRRKLRLGPYLARYGKGDA